MIQNFFLLTKVSNATTLVGWEIAVLCLVGVAIAAEMSILLVDVIKMGIGKNTAGLAWWKWALCIFISSVCLALGIVLHIYQKDDHNSLWFLSIEIIIAAAYAFVILFIMLGFKIANCVKAKKYFTTEQKLCDHYVIRNMIIRRVGKRLYKFYKSLPKEAKDKIRKFLSSAILKIRQAKHFKNTFKKKPSKIFDMIKNKVVEYAKKEFGL